MSDVLSAPLPDRWSVRQRFKNTCIYKALRALVFALRCVPRALVGPLARVLGSLAYLVAVRERRRAHAQLRRALPDAPKSTVRRMFVHLAYSVLEMVHLPALVKETPLTDAQRALLDEAFAQSRGVVAVSGHIGNWELLPQVLANAGYPVHGIAKPLYDPRLTRWVDAERTQRGAKIIWRGGKSAARDILRVFRNNHMLALYIDQDTRVEGAFVPFFERPAHTPTAAASLALRCDAPIVVGWTHRDAHGKHSVHLERFTPTQDAAASDAIVDLTAQLTSRLEHAIRMQPTQWVWMHARWKRQPIES